MYIDVGEEGVLLDVDVLDVPEIFELNIASEVCKRRGWTQLSCAVGSEADIGVAQEILLYYHMPFRSLAHSRQFRSLHTPPHMLSSPY